MSPRGSYTQDLGRYFGMWITLGIKTQTTTTKTPIITGKKRQPTCRWDAVDFARHVSRVIDPGRHRVLAGHQIRARHKRETRIMCALLLCLITALLALVLDPLAVLLTLAAARRGLK